MNEPKNIPNSPLAVTLTVDQLREIIHEEMKAASNGNHGDELLDAKEAAEILSVSEDWLYRHASKLPFTRKLAPKMLRFSFQGIQKWLGTRKLPQSS